MATRAQVIVGKDADWKYWDPVMQLWKSVYRPPTEHNDILVRGLDTQTGEMVTIYFKTDREGSWLGGTTK